VKAKEIFAACDLGVKNWQVSQSILAEIYIHGSKTWVAGKICKKFNP
jgi:hypothetical protein